MEKQKYRKSLDGYLRVGDFMVKHNKGMVTSMYRIDNPGVVYKPKMPLSVIAIQMRNSRHTLAPVLQEDR